MTAAIIPFPIAPARVVAHAPDVLGRAATRPSDVLGRLKARMWPSDWRIITNRATYAAEYGDETERMIALDTLRAIVHGPRCDWVQERERAERVLRRLAR